MSDSFDPYYKWLGIPPKDQPPNHYRLLGLELFETDIDVIDTAANRLSDYLQNLVTGPQVKHSQRLLNEVAAARRCLLNTEKKQAYDARLKSEKIGEQASSTTVTEPPAEPPVEPPVVCEKNPPPAPPKFVSGRGSPTALPDFTRTVPPTVEKKKKLPAKHARTAAKKRSRKHDSVPLPADASHLAELEQVARQQTDAGAAAENPLAASAKSVQNLPSDISTTAPVPAPVNDSNASLRERLHPPRTSDRRKWYLLGATGGLLTVVLVFGVMLNSPRQHSPHKNRQPVQRETASSEKVDPQTAEGPVATLIVQIPAADREESKVFVDGQLKTIAREGEIRIKVPQGEHVVRLERPQHETFEQKRFFTVGQQTTLPRQWKRIADNQAGSTSQVAKAAPGNPPTKTPNGNAPPSRPADGPKPKNQPSKPSQAKTADNKKSPPAAPSKPQPSPPSQPPVANSNPLGKLPAAVDLPDYKLIFAAEGQMPVVFVDSIAPNMIDKMQLTLFGGQSAFASGEFALRPTAKTGEPSPSEREWTVRFSSQGKAIDVGKFYLHRATGANQPETYELRFAWLKQTIRRGIDSLRNCLVRVTIGDQRGMVALRKTVSTQPLAVIRDNEASFERAALPALPPRGQLRLKMIAFDNGKKCFGPTGGKRASDGHHVFPLPEFADHLVRVSFEDKSDDELTITAGVIDKEKRLSKDSLTGSTIENWIRNQQQYMTQTRQAIAAVAVDSIRENRLERFSAEETAIRAEIARWQRIHAAAKRIAIHYEVFYSVRILDDAGARGDAERAHHRVVVLRGGNAEALR